jgi:hypothetical protein
MWARNSRTLVLWSVALVALGLLPAGAARAEEPPGWQTRIRTTLPLAKRDFLTEPLEAAPGVRYRVVLSGTFRFAHNDRTYDALYTTDGSGRFTQRHNYLVFSPQSLPLLEQDAARHRYVFEVPAELAESGQSISVGLDLPQMVRDFLLTPNEVVDQLTGDVVFQLQASDSLPAGELQRGNAPEARALSTTTTVHYWIAAVLLAACAAVIWSCRRAAGVPKPLREQLQRIRIRHAELQALLRSDAVRFGQVAEQVARLKQGAEALVRRLQRFGRVQDGLNAESLEREIAELEQQQRTAGRDDLQREIAATLAEKRRLLDVLGDTSAHRARYALRLSKIEAVLETTWLSVPKLDALEEDLVALHGSQRQQHVLDRIHSEMRAVEEALRELEPV